MTEHIVRDIVDAANENTTRILNEFRNHYVYNKSTAKWARKLDNCKKLLGELPKPVLIAIHKGLTK